MKLGFAKTDITPRVGVELCGFGPFLNRHSTGIRDRLWARAMAVHVGDKQAVVIACDLVGVTKQTTGRVRDLLAVSHALAPQDIMVCCSHTHSGPAPGCYIGWGEA
ncbi:MAG: neutral/alkaline non-lysosomal ceramidase N-terminal domain-containing protein, partial [Candidatus Pacebacteria bacterium]|nr:neutral/alkaline non-lysosomal ceramidase N-terminal domain-containing protein [Candidatus Paceibacterota bacterium]